MYDIITIYVTTNGYAVDIWMPDPFMQQREKPIKSWSFESMKKLQERLPEILNQPAEKRKPTIKGNQP